MSFLFGKKNKQQPNALPPATRDITSSSGPGSQIPTANGAGARDFDKGRSGPQAGTPTPGASVNNSLSSLNPATATSPEPKTLRDRTDSDFQVGLLLNHRTSIRLESVLKCLLLTTVRRTNRTHRTRETREVPKSPHIHGRRDD